MEADAFTSKGVPLGDGQYQYTITFGNGAQYVFTCRKGEQFTQLNWRMQGGRGLSPEIIANRKAQLANRKAELANREIEIANRVLDGEDEDDVEEELDNQQRLQNRERPVAKPPSGMTIAQRNRIAKLEAAYKNK